MSNLILITTYPHYIALIFTIPCSGINTTFQRIYLEYSVIILVSSSLSVAWHIHQEPKNWIFWADYIFAGLRFLIEIVVAATVIHKNILLVIIANMIVIISNRAFDYLSKKDKLQYEYGHSL